MATTVLDAYRRLHRWPAGDWLFARLVCWKAPYFATIAPRFIALAPGRCEIEIRDRRRVRNHIGTVHAIAMCNLAELAAGIMVDATLPAAMRWIPKGMTVEYLDKAVGTLRGIATPEADVVASATGYTLPVVVTVANAANLQVFRARIAMWVSPRPRNRRSHR